MKIITEITIHQPMNPNGSETYRVGSMLLGQTTQQKVTRIQEFTVHGPMSAYPGYLVWFEDGIVSKEIMGPAVESLTREDDGQ